jgi:hypothetical protein
MIDYIEEVKSAYNTSICAGIFALGFGIERLVKDDSENSIAFLVGFGSLSLVGLCLGYLIEVENKNEKNI